LNGTHQLLSYADDVNLLGGNIDTNNNTETLIEAGKEVGLEVTAEKTKYMLVSRHQNAGQNQDIKNMKRIVCKCATVQVFGNDSNKGKVD
jgi:hypothetical protein